MLTQKMFLLWILSCFFFSSWWYSGMLLTYLVSDKNIMAAFSTDQIQIVTQTAILTCHNKTPDFYISCFVLRPKTPISRFSQAWTFYIHHCPSAQPTISFSYPTFTYLFSSHWKTFHYFSTCSFANSTFCAVLHWSILLSLYACP